MPVKADSPKITDPAPSEIFDTWYVVGFSNTTNPFTKKSVCYAELMLGRIETIIHENEIKEDKFIPYRDLEGKFVKVSFNEEDFFTLIKDKAKEGNLNYKMLMDLLIDTIGQRAKERNILVVPS